MSKSLWAFSDGCPQLQNQASGGLAKMGCCALAGRGSNRAVGLFHERARRLAFVEAHMSAFGRCCRKIRSLIGLFVVIFFDE
jgi:hypothetical protein